MRRHVILLMSLTSILLALMLAGCGERSTPVTPPPVTPPPADISVAIRQAPNHLGASETYQFTAEVTNTTDTSVNWTVSGCGSLICSITSGGFYTAPSFIPSTVTVTVTATYRADATKSDSISFPLMPISVSLAPGGSVNVVPSGTRSFTAMLDHDAQNAGVTWTLSGAGCSSDSCGTLSNVTATSAVYRAPDKEPNPRDVTLKATSITDINQSAAVTITVSANPFLLSGKYAFLINGYRDGSMEAIAGQFNVDGNGTLSGVWDANRGAIIEISQPITGNYNIQSDGHGTLTIHSGSISRTYIISVADAGATARFAESVTVPSAFGGSSGYMVKQNAKNFTLSALEGDRVIAVYGEATHSHVAALGRFTLNAANAAGSLSGGVMDLCWDINQNVAKYPNTAALTGIFGPPDGTTGRGTASLKVNAAGATATYKFAYYIISDKRVLLVQTDVGGFISGLLIPTLSGEVRYQRNAGSFTNSSLNVPAVFHMTSGVFHLNNRGTSVSIGRMEPNGSGSLSVTLDGNDGGIPVLNSNFSTAYSVTASGRVTVDWATAIAYLVDQNNGYFMTPTGEGATFGVFEPQNGEPFSINSFAGTFLLNTGAPADEVVENDAGRMILDNSGTANGTLYIKTGSEVSQYSFKGPAVLASNGRGTLFLNTTPPLEPQEVVFWTISPTSAVGIMTANRDDTAPVLLHIQRTD